MDARVIAAYEWKDTSNRAKDTKGAFDLSVVGTPIFSTGVKQYDTSWQTNNGNNYFIFTEALRAELASKSAFSLQFWHKRPGGTENLVETIFFRNVNVTSGWEAGDAYLGFYQAAGFQYFMYDTSSVNERSLSYSSDWVFYSY